jgi:cytosine permease
MDRKAYLDGTVEIKTVNWFSVAGVILGAVVANLVHWGVPALNGMAVAAVCYCAGRLVRK